MIAGIYTGILRLFFNLYLCARQYHLDIFDFYSFILMNYFYLNIYSLCFFLLSIFFLINSKSSKSSHGGLLHSSHHAHHGQQKHFVRTTRISPGVSRGVLQAPLYYGWYFLLFLPSAPSCSPFTPLSLHFHNLQI